MSSRKVFLVTGPNGKFAASRTPIGDFGGSMRSITADQLATHVMTEVLRRAEVNAAHVDGVVLGHAFQSRYAPNTARFSWLKAGFPATTPCHTVELECGSGMDAVNIAMDKIRLGEGDLYVAGGSESLSTVPYYIPGDVRFNGYWATKIPFLGPKLANFARFGPLPFLGFTIADNALAPRPLLWDLKTTHMAGTAQILADHYGISRQAADEYAYRSQTRAIKAIDSGRFAEEIDPIVTKVGAFAQDEHPYRKTSPEKLAKLRGVHKTTNITAGNSSGVNDGACVLLLASEDACNKHGLTPLCELVDHAVAGVDPNEMGLGPVAAITKLLTKLGCAIGDVGLWEINEAFAAQYLACEKLLGLNREIVNVNGGAIALGHPIAMSGARVIQTLALQQQSQNVELAVASLCIGGGMGKATALRKV